jgi:Zn-dependent oligopeptidase
MCAAVAAGVARLLESTVGVVGMVARAPSAASMACWPPSMGKSRREARMDRKDGSCWRLAFRAPSYFVLHHHATHKKLYHQNILAHRFVSGDVKVNFCIICHILHHLLEIHRLLAKLLFFQAYANVYALIAWPLARGMKNR